MKINETQALSNLMELLAAEGPSGGEGPVAAVVQQLLLNAGAQPDWFCFRGSERLPEAFEIGNLIVQIPGTAEAPRIMFSAHLDTVPICQGAVPVLRGERIVPAGATGLGADNRTSVATLVTMAQTLLRERALSHPPLTLLFTVGEENGLHGAKAFEPQDGGNPAMCFNIDGCSPRGGIIGALGATRWCAKIRGIGAHAAAHPEGGVSAALIAAHAIADATAQGYFGRIDQGAVQGTANVGALHGGSADNEVMDALTVTGECRSHDPAALQTISKVWSNAFERAARALQNNRGECGSVELIEKSTYRSFLLDEDEPAVQRYLNAAPRAGRAAAVEVISAGLDANILNEKGIPTVTFDAGNDFAHSLQEYVDIPRYLNGCLLALELALEN